jgi:Fe-S-cluster containining protein
MVDQVAVPCGSCRACCHNEIVVLFPEKGDDLASFEHIEVVDAEGTKFAVLKMHKETGACVYLGENGCTIHDRAPAVCRAFDCRGYFLSMTRADRRLTEKHSRQKEEIFAAARKRLHTLTPEQHQHALAHRRFIAHGSTRAMLAAYSFGGHD